MFATIEDAINELKATVSRKPSNDNRMPFKKVIVMSSIGGVAVAVLVYVVLYIFGVL